MKKQRNLLGIFLAAVTGAVLLAALLLRTFLPRIILPRLDLPAMVLLCVIALVLDFYIGKRSSRNFLLLALYGALIFGLLPFAAGFLSPMAGFNYAILGGVVFPLVTFLFDMMIGRLFTRPMPYFAPLLCGFGLYLAAQALMGLI